MFIIIAVVIVGVAIAIYFLYPKITSEVITTTPSEEIRNCLEGDIKDTIEKISMQGGNYEPQFYYNYQGEKVEYLCYTNEYYKECVRQIPLIKKHIESEIKSAIEERVETCFNSLEKNYKNKGFEVTINRKDYEVEIIPEKVSTQINYEVNLKKGDTSDSYNSFTIDVNSNLLDLTNIAEDILSWEANYGDADAAGYMLLYSWLKVEKMKQTGGTTVYILTHRNSGDKFQFASRSVALASGYGL